MIRRSLALAVALSLACNSSDNKASSSSSAPATSSADSAFSTFAHEVITDHLTRYPSASTDLGVHANDARIEDFSQAGIQAETKALQAFRTRLVALDTTPLSVANRADRELLLRSIDAAILSNEVIRPWAKNADSYSGGITNAAYVIMKREFAPAPERLRSLIARERQMPAALAEAKRNLDNPPRIFTQIAIEQIDGNIAFFRNDVPAAFSSVKDSSLLHDFRQTNDSVIAALAAYKKWLSSDLLSRSNGSYAYGADTYQKALAAAEMIELPLDQLLAIAEADRATNESAFQRVARQIDPKKSANAVLASLQSDHPPAAQLLSASQGVLDSLRAFISDHHIVTIPASEPARVMETPPFMRSTTSASMDTPGPFEPAKLEARYNMTLPDPRWAGAKQNEFMGQWYYAAIANVSVHEVYPGHYTQFLYAKQFPGEVRKVYGAASNIEGWAHYDEQMMIDEGFHASDPQYRLAQLQDALLRDVRFIVGIKLHTQGMTVPQATELFVTQAHQPRPIAESEAKRGTGDALYGYYTMGKLAILKLRDDYKAKLGPAYTLQKFNDEFVKLGPLPLPLIRTAMLGQAGSLFAASPVPAK